MFFDNYSCQKDSFGGVSMDNKLSMIMGSRLITLSTVSRNTGISRNTLTGIYYKRVKAVKLDTLVKLCDYLQVPLHDLIDYQPKED